MLSTSDTLPGRDVDEVLGIVKGNAIRGSHLGADITAFLRNLIGGEIEEYTKTMAEAREQALDRMIDEARNARADAVVGVRYSTSFIAPGTAEFFVYGTAVRLRPL